MTENWIQTIFFLRKYKHATKNIDKTFFSQLNPNKTSSLPHQRKIRHSTHTHRNSHLRHRKQTMVFSRIVKWLTLPDPIHQYITYNIFESSHPKRLSLSSRDGVNGRTAVRYVTEMSLRIRKRVLVLRILGLLNGKHDDGYAVRFVSMELGSGWRFCWCFRDFHGCLQQTFAVHERVLACFFQLSFHEICCFYNNNKLHKVWKRIIHWK